VHLRRRRVAVKTRSDEWSRRPALSRALKAAIFLGPILASLLIATILSHLLPRASGPFTAVLWIVVVALGSFLTLVVFERAARRLLPLAALLNVALLFPDKAPARFAVARKTGSPRELQAQLLAARASGRLDDAQGMQSVIELVLALSVHDKATRGHSERVRVFADLIADELKVDAAGQARLRWAALLHDVGKLEVPVALLNKPSAPDVEEWKVLHRHPEEGARLVAPLLPWLGEWGKAVVEHHERFDGTGYPHQLKGHEISLAARIVAVADVYEVMTAPRPYKRAMSIAAARQELTRVAGTQLDPIVVRAFLNISVGRLWRTIGFGAWFGQIPAISRLWAELGKLGTLAGSGALSATTGALLTIGALGTPLPPTTTGLLAAQHPGSQGASTVTTRSRALPRRGVLPTSPPVSTPRPSPTPHAKPAPTPKPKPVSPPPPPTPKPTPTPAPNPWSCATCTNTSPTCTNHCRGNNLFWCTSYCEGNYDWACASHCFGNNDYWCFTYCAGQNDGRCQSNCRSNKAFADAAMSSDEPTLTQERQCGRAQDALVAPSPASCSSFTTSPGERSWQNPFLPALPPGSTSQPRTWMPDDAFTRSSSAGRPTSRQARSSAATRCSAAMESWLPAPDR
jgi:HD-GYP domain-containing protein (c-di-GMP phosphodiesterase class II)